MTKRIVYRLIGLFAISSSVVFAEPSVYSDSDVDYQYEANTYNGRVTEEPTISSLKHEIERQNERISGLTTLVEGLSRSLFELKQEGGDVSTAPDGDQSATLKELAQKIDKIEGDYVSKIELERILNGQKGATPYVAPVASAPKETQTPTPKNEYQREPSSAIKDTYMRAVRSFAKRNYSDAQEGFEKSITEDYKVASSNYYLGEIAYYTKRYADATAYFKKSVELDENAGYVDVLLLHTAISLENVGEKEKAKQFYENIIENYKGFKTAEIAQERIGKL